MAFKAIIFDFDGVITDTEPVHMQAWLEVFNPLGISFDKDEYDANYLGLNDRDFLDAVGRIHNRPFPDEEKARLIPQKLKHSIGLLSTQIPVLPGVEDFIELTSKKFLLAICSGAMKEEVHFILKKIGWLKLFNPIITQEDVVRGKPDPECYKLTLRHLNERLPVRNLSATDCLAIEDSPKGIKAAHQAGMSCLAISNSYPPDALDEAEWVVGSLEEFEMLF
jgi:HAD superfamily hydrolase (TIGR01509 family)